MEVILNDAENCCYTFVFISSNLILKNTIHLILKLIILAIDEF